MIPANVSRVSWLRQFQNRPRATSLKAEDERATTIESPIVVARNHEFMDDAPEFHQVAMRVAAE